MNFFEFLLVKLLIFTFYSKENWNEGERYWMTLKRILLCCDLSFKNSTLSSKYRGTKREANLKVIVIFKEWNDGLSQRINCSGNEKWLCLEYALKMKQVVFFNGWIGCRVMRIWWTWGWRLPAWGIGWIRRVLEQWEILRLKQVYKGRGRKEPN